MVGKDNKDNKDGRDGRDGSDEAQQPTQPTQPTPVATPVATPPVEPPVAPVTPVADEATGAGVSGGSGGGRPQIDAETVRELRGLINDLKGAAEPAAERRDAPPDGPPARVNEQYARARAVGAQETVYHLPEVAAAQHRADVEAAQGFVGMAPDRYPNEVYGLPHPGLEPIPAPEVDPDVARQRRMGAEPGVLTDRNERQEALPARLQELRDANK